MSYWVDSNGDRSSNWNSRQTRREEYVRNLGIDLHDFIGAPTYGRNSSKVLECEYEFKEISANCVLIKRTNTIWNLPRPTGRYERITDAQVTAARRGTPNVVEEQIFALLIDDGLKPSAYVINENARNTQQRSLYLGLEVKLTGNSQNHIRGDKTTPAEHSVTLQSSEVADKVMIIKELRGSSAKFWNQENIDEQAITRVLRPSESSGYILPSKDTVKRKKIQWHENDANSFTVGDLQFSKMDAKPQLTAGDTLHDIYRSEGINIILSIPEKCMISFPRDGEQVSHEIDSGVFAVRTMIGSQGSIYNQRLGTLERLRSYRIEFDLTRYDFLTVVDIDTNVITTTDGSLSRIGSTEEINEQIVSEDESLLDRIG